MQDFTSIFDISQKIVDLYKENLLQAGMEARGQLYNFKWNVDFNGQIYQLVLNLPPEWYWVEHGRRPSAKMPPVDAIMNWITVKRLVPKARNGKVPTTRGLAFAIAKKIQREGFYSPGHHGKFPLQKSLQEATPYVQELADEISKLLNKPITEDLIHIADGLKYITKE